MDLRVCICSLLWPSLCDVCSVRSIGAAVWMDSVCFASPLSVDVHLQLRAKSPSILTVSSASTALQR